MAMGLFMLVLTYGVASADMPAVSADNAPDSVPLGVYLSWERIAANAKVRSVGRWEDLNGRLDALRDNHVNFLWVTNMSEADLPRLAEECVGRSIRLLPCVDSMEAKVEWRWADGRYYDEVLPRIVNIAGNAAAITGWVLSDEPEEKDFPHLEVLRTRLCELDPGRFTTAVFMWPQAAIAPARVKLPVYCVDLYPFFGPNDPNGPHTDAASRHFYRGHVAHMLDAIGESSAVGWIMGMCFNDIWGPKKYNDAGHLVGLPGSYLHWRAPTPAEMRWQVWEAFRGGAKGFFCYTLAPEAPDPSTVSAAPPEVTWTEVLAHEETDLGPNALTNPDGSVTPQLETLGRVYAALAPWEPLIRRWRRESDGGIETESPASVQVFSSITEGERYAILLNDDLQQEQSVNIRLNAPFVFLRDLVQNQDIPLTAAGAGCMTGRISLEAGDGRLLQLDVSR